MRSRLAAELLALVGIAVGVALVFAALIANTSLTGAVRQLSDGLVGGARFQLSARGSDGFDQRVFGEVDRIEGVSSAAPILEVRGNLAGPKGLRSVLFIGGDPRFARFGGELLRHAALPDRREGPGLVLPVPLAAELGVVPGEEVRVETGAGVGRVEVAGVLGPEEVGSLVDSPVALGPLPLVQRVAGLPGRVSRIFVNSAQERERTVERDLAEVAGERLELAPADREVAVFEQAAYPTNQSTAIFSALSALVGFLFALSAMLLTVPQRRRLISELRMAGYGPLATVSVLLFDALALGGVAAVLGLLLGDQASRHLFDTVPGYLTSAFAIGSQRIVTWQSVGIALGVGIAAACIAVLAPLRDALSRNPPPQVAIATSTSREPWLTAAGDATFISAMAIAFFAPAAALLGIVLLTISMLLLLPVLLGLAARGFDRIGRRLNSSALLLAVLELGSGAARIRTLAVAATGAIAVFATVSIGGARADLQRGLDAAVRDVNRDADIWVSFRGDSNTFGATAFSISRQRLAAIRRLPGVRAVRPHRAGFLDVGDHRAWVLAPPRSVRHPLPKSQLRSGDARLATARLRAGGWLVLSEGIAAALDVEAGERVRLPAPAPAGFRVAGLSTNVGWPGGAIVVNADDFARAWKTRAVGSLGIEVAPGASLRAVARAVEAALGARLPLRVETRDERMDRHFDASRAGLSRLNQISAMVLIAAVLALAAAMGGMIWQRRPTLAALKVHGYEERELWRSLLLESGLLLGTGCLVGAVFGLTGQVLLDQALEAITGFPVVYVVAGRAALTVLGLVTGVAVAVLSVPGWFAARVRPSSGIPN